MSKLHDVILVNKFIQTLADLTGDATMPSQQQMLLLSLYTSGTVN